MPAITVDNIYPVPQVVSALLCLSVKPYVRIVVDPGMSPSHYDGIIKAVSLNDPKQNRIILEPIDSQALSGYSVPQVRKHFQAFIKRHKESLFAVEVANEINGDWVGPRAYQKAKTALGVANEFKIPSVVTYYLDGDDPEQMLRWIDKNEKLTSDYAFISYYPREAEKTVSSLQVYFEGLHVRFPKALLGIGEFGANSSSQGEATEKTKIEIINKYYNLNITTPNYVGFGGYWNFVSDVVQKNGQLNMPMIEVFHKAVK